MVCIHGNSGCVCEKVVMVFEQPYCIVSTEAIGLFMCC